MKKLFSLVLAVLMVLSCFAITASAKDFAVSEGKDVTVAIDDVTAKVGEVVTVKVFVKFAEGHVGISDGAFTVNYPADKLELVVEETDGNITYPKWLFSGAMVPSVTQEVAGSFLAGFANFNFVAPNTAVNGDFFEMKFKVLEGATGKIDIEFDAAASATYFNTTVNYMPTPVAVELINGSVTIEAEKFDVTFTTEQGTAPEAVTGVEAGTEIDLPVLEDTDDYTFRGWSDGETTYTGKFTVNATVTLTAVWQKIEKYTVTFATTIGEAPAAVENVVTGTEIQLAVLEDTEDAKFKGWAEEGTDDVLTGKYVVTKTVTLNAVWEEIVRYTVTYSEGFEPATIIAGESVTLPTLTNDELSFKGWKVGDTDEILAGGTVYVPTASVLLVAQWGGAKKVYISAEGNDANNGFTADAPVATLQQAYKIINTEGNTIEEIIVIGVVPVAGSAVNAEGNGTAWNYGIAGKALTIKGQGDGACLYAYGNSGFTDTAIDGYRFYFVGDVTVENITFNSTNTSEVPYAFGMASSLTIKDGVKFLCRTSKKVDGVTVVDKLDQVRPLAASEYTDPKAEKLDLTLNLEDEALNVGKVYAGFGYAGNTRTGKVTVNHNKGTLANLIFSKGSTGTAGLQIFKGEGYYNINGGKITNLRFGYGMSYHGLGYATINGGEITKIYTTGINSSYAIWTTVVQQENSGVRVWEINGGTVGAIERDPISMDAHKGFEDAFVNVKRVVIFNDGVEAVTVSDTGAIVLDVTGAKLSADVTVAEDYTTTLNGFTYAFPVALAAEYNAVKVGDKIYRLDELENDLIPAPTAAGVYEVEFTNVYKVTVGDETTLVEEGDTISLTRLPQNGELKHIGWATTEGATVAEIDHTTDYVVTGNATLYPVWATAVYFTATFETAHGTAPEAISIIDDDEDGKADEAFMFPGYDGKQDGHFTFTGWMDVLYVGAPEGTTIPKYNAGDILFLDGNKTFVATWEEDPKGTVTYRNESGEAPESYTEYVGTEIVIAECPAVEGFEFLGWISNGVTYQPGEKVTIEDEFGITFTAKWGVKVAVDANGAKGEVPVIGGTIGEEIDLPTDVNLTMVNHTFVGWATSADGEVITGKYTVNPDDTLYAIWVETVANAAIIETKVTYYTGAGNYFVDVYYYGADANTIAFGYAFGENLTYAGFAPAEGLSLPDASLEVVEEGYFSTVVTDETGKIEGASAEAGNGIHLGTIAFTYAGTKEDYAEDDAADNVVITTPAEVVNNISSEEYFLYTPTVGDLNVIGLPVVFDEAIEVEIIDIVYTLTGSVKVVREDGTAPKNYAEIIAYNEAGVAVKTFVIEDDTTETTDGVFNYSINLPEGTYTLEINKIGYLPAYVDVEVLAQEGAEEEGFVPEDIEVEAVELIAGDVVSGLGVIDLLDFAGITSSFGRGDIGAENIIALDIDEDGVVTVNDLNYVKSNFGKKAE